MIEALSFTFIQHAIIAGVLVSFAAGIVGSLIVVNRLVFLAGGIAHASYGGIGLAVYFGLPIFLGASLFALLTALFIALLSLHSKHRTDTFIGVFWAVGMAIGILLIDLTPGYNVDLAAYLFGSILSVSKEELYFMGIFLIILIAVVLFLYRDILAVSYDTQYAKLSGIHTTFIYTLILMLSALSIVIAIKVVGIILVIALLTIPVYIAEKFSTTLMGMMLYSGLLATLFTLIGLILSYHLNLSSGASIILVSTLSLVLFLTIYKVLQKRN
jgi:zinc transport system permease protein